MGADFVTTQGARAPATMFIPHTLRVEWLKTFDVHYIHIFNITFINEDNVSYVSYNTVL